MPYSDVLSRIRAARARWEESGRYVAGRAADSEAQRLFKGGIRTFV